MFDHRLGLALGKSLVEIGELSFDEWLSWRDFEILEPFGWPDREYRLGALIAALSIKQHSRSPKDFMRDIVGRVLSYQKPRDLSEMSRDEVIAQIKRDFGI